MTALFPPADLDGDPLAGFRLQRLEVLNWGTFDRRVVAAAAGRAERATHR